VGGEPRAPDPVWPQQLPQPFPAHLERATVM
jgi:hypothetical protein